MQRLDVKGNGGEGLRIGGYYARHAESIERPLDGAAGDEHKAVDKHGNLRL